MSRYPQKSRTKLSAPRRQNVNSPRNSGGGVRQRPRPEKPRQRIPRWPVNQNRLTPAQKGLLGLSLKLLRFHPWLNVALSLGGDQLLLGMILGDENIFYKDGWTKVVDCNKTEDQLTSAHSPACVVNGITSNVNWLARLGTLDNSGNPISSGGGFYTYSMGYVNNPKQGLFSPFDWTHKLASIYNITVPINTTVTESLVNAPQYSPRFIGVPLPAPQIGFMPMLFPIAGGAAERPIPISFLPERVQNPFIPNGMDFVAYSPSTRSPTPQDQVQPLPNGGTHLYNPVIVGVGSIPVKGTSMKPPKKGTKERKVKMNGAAALAFKVVAELTEVGDFVKAMSEGFSETDLAEYKKLKGLHNKLEFLYRHWLDEDFDIGKAITGLVKNQIEDAIVGRIIRGYNKSRTNISSTGIRGLSAPRL